MVEREPASQRRDEVPILRLVQITDTHLFGHPEGRLLGVDTQHCLDLVVDQLSALAERPDLIIATGDISQDASAESYRRFAVTLSRLPVPCYWLPGNHDRFEVMRNVSGLESLSQAVVRHGDWQIIMLDSTLPGATHGHLGASEFERLERLLQMAAGESHAVVEGHSLEHGLPAASDAADKGESPTGGAVKHTLVCLHHNPVPGDAAWMQDIGLNNSDKLIGLLKRYPSVRAVVHGHIHQDRDCQADGLRFICTPATCIQFKPDATDFELDNLAPGWRWFNLYADGGIETGVQRLEIADVGADFTSTGY